MKFMQVSSYLTAVLSNVEKRFGLASKEVAWVYSGNEISQIALVFFLPLIGQVRKRPLWLGVSNCAAAVGILIIALPHFISKLIPLLNFIFISSCVMPPRSFSQKVRPSRWERHWQPALPDEREQCGAMPGRGGRRHDQGYWQHGHHLFRHIRQRFRELPFLRFRSVYIETGGTFVAGFNVSIAFTGMPYIDDNSPRQNSPLRISIALAARYRRRSE